MHPVLKFWSLIESSQQNLVRRHVLMHLYRTIAFEVCCIWSLTSVECFWREFELPFFENFHEWFHLFLSLRFRYEEFSVCQSIVKYSVDFPKIFEQNFTSDICVSFCLKMLWFHEVLPFVSKRFIQIIHCRNQTFINKLNSLFLVNTVFVNFPNKPVLFQYCQNWVLPWSVWCIYQLRVWFYNQ